MDNIFEDYILEDDERRKKTAGEKHLNEFPYEYSEEREMENLLSLAFDPLDVSDSVSETIDRLNSNSESVSGSVLKTIKEKKKKRVLLFSFSTVAAILALSLVLVNLNNGNNLKIKVRSTGENYSVENSDGSKGIKIGSQIKGSAKINLPEGVVVMSSPGAVYTFLNEIDGFLELRKGTLNIGVESRKDKEPLYFNLPHGTVKVTGTSFILNCSSQVSEVRVMEGTVELITESKSLEVGTGESGSTGRRFIKKAFDLPDTKSSYSFENLSEDIQYSGSPRLSIGLLGNALKLDGRSGGILSRDHLVGDETISFWFKQDQLRSKAQSIISQHDAKGSFNGFHLYIEKGDLHLQMKDQSKSEERTLRLSEDGWQHLTFCRKASGLFTMYINAEAVYSGQFPFSYKSDDLYIGKSRDSFWDPLKGYIDELRVYNRFISQGEVRKLYSERKLSIKK